MAIDRQNDNNTFENVVQVLNLIWPVIRHRRKNHNYRLNNLIYEITDFSCTETGANRRLIIKTDQAIPRDLIVINFKESNDCIELIRSIVMAPFRLIDIHYPDDDVSNFQFWKTLRRLAPKSIRDQI